MLNNLQFRNCIVRPALEEIKHYSPDAEELLVATMAHESKGGIFVAQQGGPALGIYQMEPFTYDSLWNSYIIQFPELLARILGACRYTARPTADHLMWNMRLSTIMTRVFYLQVKEALPNKNDIEGIWHIYKTYYNTSKGSATKEDFIANYNRFIGKENSDEKRKKS